MTIKNKIYGFLIAVKNRQIRFERERLRALEETNKILSAYVAILVESLGETRISKELVREALGSYKASVKDSGDDYLISVTSTRKGKIEKGIIYDESFVSQHADETEGSEPEAWHRSCGDITDLAKENGEAESNLPEVEDDGEK